MHCICTVSCWMYCSRFCGMPYALYLYSGMLNVLYLYGGTVLYCTAFVLWHAERTVACHMHCICIVACWMYCTVLVLCRTECSVFGLCHPYSPQHIHKNVAMLPTILRTWTVAWWRQFFPITYRINNVQNEYRQEPKPEPEAETETVERVEPEPAPFIPRPPTPPPMPNLELETLLGTGYTIYWTRCQRKKIWNKMDAGVT